MRKNVDTEVNKSSLKSLRLNGWARNECCQRHSGRESSVLLESPIGYICWLFGHCPLNACRNALCALISRGSKPLPRYFCTFFIERKVLRSVLYIWGQGGGLKLFFLWDFPFPKSSNYNTICSKLWLNNSQLPQSCRHCFPNQHQQVWR